MTAPPDHRPDPQTAEASRRNPPQPLTGHPLTAPGPPAASPGTVKKPLTPNRRRRVAENTEYAAFTRRVLAAYARRIASGDIDALTAMAVLADDTDTAIRQAVTGLRRFGYSWAEIGHRLGVTRQAAQQRWGHQPASGGDAA